MGKKITFNVSTGYIGCTRTETLDIEEVYGVNIDEMNDIQREEFLEEIYEDWIWENINGDFYIGD